MPKGEENNDAVPKSEDEGTNGGSLSLNVSMFSKEIEEIKPMQQTTRPASLSRPGGAETRPIPDEDPVAALESEAIQMFIAVARLLGYPRSVGEIFGILFAAEKPLTFEGISRKRGISAGSVSVGLRHLRNLGVIVATPVAGDRRDHFTVNDDFGRVNALLVRHHIEPRVSAARRRIDRIKIMADELARSGPHGDLATRLQRFADWQSQLMRVIVPLLKADH
jgi:DNA-binding transcriptional regulator GbsR (MarR family)